MPLIKEELILFNLHPLLEVAPGFSWSPLYALESAADPAPPKKAKPRKKRKTRADKIRDALGSLSREELYALLLELALDDREVAHLVLARHGPDKENEQAYARLVQDALRLGQGRHGFLDYWGAARAAKGVRELLNRADAHLAQGRPLLAIPIYQAVIEGMVPAMAQADDSMGALGDCIHFALDGLQRAAEELAPSERAGLFTYWVAEAPKDLYAGWDWGWDLASIAVELVETLRQRAILFAALDQMVARRDDEGWGADWGRLVACLPLRLPAAHYAGAVGPGRFRHPIYR